MNPPLSATLGAERVAELAAALRSAENDASPVLPHGERGVALTLEDAYAIQQANLVERERSGRRLVGRKIGLTSRAMQDMLGVSEPDFGYLTDDLLLATGTTLPRDALIAPRVEVEIAFRLNRDLSGPQVTAADVMAATNGVAAALEVIDSRIVDWRIDLFDTVADNASCARAIVGEFVSPADLKLERLTAQLRLAPCRDRRTEIVEGDASAVLGHPAQAVAWLAQTLSRLEGEALRAGDVVLSGAMARALPVSAGDHVTADVAQLGRVEVTFAEAGDR